MGWEAGGANSSLTEGERQLSVHSEPTVKRPTSSTRRSKSSCDPHLGERAEAALSDTLILTQGSQRRDCKKATKGEVPELWAESPALLQGSPSPCPRHRSPSCSLGNRLKGVPQCGQRHSKFRWSRISDFGAVFAVFPTNPFTLPFCFCTGD